MPLLFLYDGHRLYALAEVCRLVVPSTPPSSSKHFVLCVGAAVLSSSLSIVLLSGESEKNI